MKLRLSNSPALSALLFFAVLVLSAVFAAPPQEPRGLSVGAFQQLAPQVLNPKLSLRSMGTYTFRHTTGKTVAADTDYTYFSRHIVGETVKGWLYLLYTGFHTNTSAGEQTQANVGGYVTLSGSLDIYDGSAYNLVGPLQFPGGASSWALPPKGLVWARVYVGNIPAGKEIRVRTRRQCTTNMVVPIGFASGGTYGGFVSGDATTTLVPSLTTSEAPYAPAAICALSETNGPMGVGLIGDSITYGRGDSTDAGGWAVRALQGAAIGYVQVCKGGERMSEWIGTYSKRTARLRAVSTMPVVICAYGHNDIIGDGASLATIKANALLTWAELSQGGTRRVYQTTITPRTNSTDSWATMVNQTVYNPTYEAVRVAFNTWLRDGTAQSDSGGTLTGYIDVANTFEVNAAGTPTMNGGYWPVTGAANYATADGYHPSAALHAIMATAINSTLTTYWKAGAGLSGGFVPQF